MEFNNSNFFIKIRRLEATKSIKNIKNSHFNVEFYSTLDFIRSAKTQKQKNIMKISIKSSVLLQYGIKLSIKLIDLESNKRYKSDARQFTLCTAIRYSNKTKTFSIHFLQFFLITHTYNNRINK